MKIPKNYVIVEIIPSHSDSKKGFIVQLQALKVKNNQIIKRLDLRVCNELIYNNDLLKIISYDKDMFTYTTDKESIKKTFKDFIGKDKLLIIDNFYTRDYLSDLENEKINVFDYLDLEISNHVFDDLIKKYHLEPSNHLVDLLYESLVFRGND